MGSLDELIRDLRHFDRRKEVTNALARELRKPVPDVRKAIRRRAIAILPRQGGFGVWVSKLSITAQVKLQGRNAGVRLKGKHKRGYPDDNREAELRRLDQGMARHPSWGRRAKKDWHLQRVTPGFFTGPAAEINQWRNAAIEAVDNAVEVIRRG